MRTLLLILTFLMVTICGCSADNKAVQAKFDAACAKFDVAWAAWKADVSKFKAAGAAWNASPAGIAAWNAAKDNWNVAYGKDFLGSFGVFGRDNNPKNALEDEVSGTKMLALLNIAISRDKASENVYFISPAGMANILSPLWLANIAGYKDDYDKAKAADVKANADLFMAQTIMNQASLNEDGLTDEKIDAVKIGVSAANAADNDLAKARATYIRYKAFYDNAKAKANSKPQ